MPSIEQSPDSQTPTFYIVYWVESHTTLRGKYLKPGYYRITYSVSGVECPHSAQYSTDRCKWEDCGELFKDIQGFSDLFRGVGSGLVKFERLDYVETVVYRGQHVPVFIDDYGQCFYCIFNNREIAFGSFQSDYADEVRRLVDYELDLKSGKLK